MKVFTVAPGGSGAGLIFGGLAVFMLALAVLFVFFAFASRNLRFEVGEGELKIRGDIYGRTIPISRLIVDEAEAIRLRDTEYRLRWKRNGTAVPGYRSGWFSLRNGMKALVFVTDQDRVVRIPTRDGYQLLVSPGDPTSFIAALKSASGAGN